MTISYEEAANVMFPSMSSTEPQPRSAAPETDDDRRAERLFGEPKPERFVQAKTDTRPFEQLTENEKSARLFGDTDPVLSHADAVQGIINAAIEDQLANPEAAGEIAAEWAQTFTEHGLSSTESKQIVDIATATLRNPPTEAQVTSWTETAITNLQVEYGVQNAGQALADARSFVDAHPDIREALDMFGLGSHPRLVALCAAKGRAMRLAGKLR